MSTKRADAVLSDGEADQLAAEYRAWRLEASLLPSRLVELRFRPWRDLLAHREFGPLPAHPVSNEERPVR